MKKDTKSRKLASRSRKRPDQVPQGDLIVKFELRGPDQATIDGVSRALIEAPSVQKYLKRSRYRMLSFELIEPEVETKTSQIPTPTKRYRATIYDYANNRTIFVEGNLDKPKFLEVTESSTQPLPSSEEFDAALKTLLKEPEIGPAIHEKRLRPYRPMPPLIEAELLDGSIERTIAVGLLPSDGGVQHEIVGVNMIRQKVMRFERRAPERALAHNPICGLPYAGQGTANKGTAGQAWVTVTQGRTTLWKFLAVRPAASSGTNGSGIELRYVDYRGKRVLYQAHVPILNVRYDNDACGPYRDWQWQEGMLQANGTDPVPGFRLCPNPAQTIIDSGTDTGNFLGAAIYVQGQEVVLVSEMEAGWYRYISQWRLHADGTIRPRFGFSAVQNSCVCNIHHHHVYWRLDLDIRTPGNNLVEEFNDPPLVGSSNWHKKRFEIRRLRDTSRKRKWRITNTSTGERYELIPGVNDGTADSFGVGDLWVLRYHGSEIDDGQGFTTDPAKAKANIDEFVNGELVENQDVVVWYAAHFTHDVGAEPPGTFGHIVGPDLKPINW